MSESNPITMQCPACGQPLSITPQLIGQTVTCPTCQRPVIPVAAQTAPMAMGYASPQQSLPTSAMAIASLVCGCLLCIPLIGVLALIFGIIGLKQTSEQRRSGRGMAIAGTVLGGINVLGSVGYLALVVSIMIPSLSRAREMANRVKCASNMRQIGQAMLLYANQNKGAYPPDLTTLAKADGTLSTNMFVCPSGNDTPAPDWAHLASGGHLSYIYVGNGMNTAAVPNAVLLYENPAEHGGDGMNVLFGDGHVEYENGGQTKRIVQQLNAGQNPPKLLGQ